MNGINQTAWALGAAQARRGHQVTFLVDHASPSQVQDAAALGIDLRTLTEASRVGTPDVIHMHSVFIPAQAKLAKWAHRRSIPYVISPNGGVAPQIFQRGRLKKFVYSAALERPRFRAAGSLTAVTAAEKSEIEAFVGRTDPPVFVIPNATNPAPQRAEVKVVACEDLVYLGRFDAFAKGLDRIAALAVAMPSVTFGLYGTASVTAMPSFPSNVTVHPPVYGEDKWAVLRSASAYLQLSRWEAFGLSIFEAMMIGTPVVVSEEVHVRPFVQTVGGLAVDADDARTASTQVDEFLRAGLTDADRERLSAAAREFVDPDAVAAQFDTAYAACLGR